MTSASSLRALRQLPAAIVLALAAATAAHAAKPAKPAAKRVCSGLPCEQALAQLDRALSAEVAAAGRAGAQLLLQQPNDGRYKGSKVNAQIAAVHGRAAAPGSGPWYLVHARRTPQGGVEVKGLYALSAKAGKAATATNDGMALELGNPQRPDVQPLATALSTLVGTLPAKPKTLPESQLPKWLGGSSLVAVAGYDAATGRLAHFAVVPDVIDVRLTGNAAVLPPGAPPAAVGSAGPNPVSPNVPGVNQAPTAMAVPPTPAAIAADTARTAAAKGGKVRGQVISQRPGETIMLLSDEQGRPKGLQFDVDPVLLEQTQQQEAQQQRSR